MYDFNVLEQKAKSLTKDGKYKDALKLYFFMADGDNALDGGHLGERIGYCYEMLGDLAAAKYWYGRAVEENPDIDVYVRLRANVEHVNIDDIIDPDSYIRK